MSLLSQKHLQDEAAAYEWVEAQCGRKALSAPSAARLSASPRWPAKRPASASTSATPAVASSASQWGPSSRTAMSRSQVAAGLLPDRRQQEGHFAATSSTARWA